MKKPTIRALIDEIRLMPEAEDAANIGLTLAERVEAVLTVHHLTTDERWPKVCADCFKPWPCPTIRALNGEQP